jgi:ribonuclease HII
VVAAARNGVSPIKPDLSEEAALTQGGFRLVAGVDEAGRGAWAGPLVAGAVILPDAGTMPAEAWHGVRDSKLCTSEQRDRLFELILERAQAVGVGAVAADEIDLLGLTAANELAMARAVRTLHPAPDALLVDAFLLRSVALPQRAIIRGDQRCLSIAAASIVAKVYRDRWLAGLAECYPGYGLEQHRGYGAPVHRGALAELGATTIHRMSYAPLRALCER